MQLFDDDVQTSLHTAVAKKDNIMLQYCILSRELKRFYQLQMRIELMEDIYTNRINFGQ